MGKARLIVLGLVFAVFTVYSTQVVIEHGYTGFLTLAANHAWGMQVFIDLVIALSLFGLWMFRDAQERGLVFWPFFLLTLTLGSIGALAYLIMRELKGRGEVPLQIS